MTLLQKRRGQGKCRLRPRRRVFQARQRFGVGDAPADQTVAGLFGDVQAGARVAGGGTVAPGEDNRADGGEIVPGKVGAVADSSGRWLVSEIELIEPVLYADLYPEVAPRLVEGIGLFAASAGR